MSDERIFDTPAALDKLGKITTEVSQNKIKFIVNMWADVLRKKDPHIKVMSISVDYFDTMTFDIDNERYEGPTYLLIFLAGNDPIDKDDIENIIFLCPVGQDDKVHRFGCSFDYRKQLH